MNTWAHNCPAVSNPSQEDTDSDGFGDACDECPDSDLGKTVVINDCDSGVPNPLFLTGCTLADLVNDALAADDEDVLEDLLESFEDQGLLTELKLGHEQLRPSAGIRWLLPHDRFFRIRAEFTRFFDTFSGVGSYPGSKIITYRIEEPHRWGEGDPSGAAYVCQPEVRLLAVSGHTELPTAMSFYYLGGQLVLMPPFETPDDAVSGLLASDLKELGSGSSQR